MGLIKGRATISRYRVAGDIPPDFWDFIDRRVRANVFKDIEQSTAEIAVGWTSVTDFMDTEFAYAAYSLSPYVVLGLRVDQRKVAASLLHKYHRLEVDKAMGYLEEGRKLGRVRREELKDKVRLELLARIPPSSQLFEVIWDTSRNELWLGSAARKVMDLFEDLFIQSFGLELIPRIPFLLARDLLAKSPLVTSLEEARPWGPLSPEA